jgi:FKBP-type peptidyl-prolyl cis-trans isomerase FklB
MNVRTTTYVILACLAAGFTTRADEQNVLKDDREKASYAIGLNLGNNLKRQEIDADYDALIRGLKDARAGGPTLLNETEARAALAKFQQEFAAKQQEKRRQLAAKNKQQGEVFLAENKNKPGVITLTNGLQYKVLKDGDGPSPKPEDSVTVNYRGTTIDGAEFDSSAKLGKPALFRVSNIFPGWAEALSLMKTGAKWQLFIPSQLAYGEAGKPPVIGPNATLLLEVELLAVHPPPPPAAVAPGQQLTSDIIKVPSLEEMKKGAQIETIKPEEFEKLQKQPGAEKK